jgi:hypothetical protein
VTAGEPNWPPRRTERWRGRLVFFEDGLAWHEEQTFPPPTPRIWKLVNGRRVLVTLAELEVELLEEMWNQTP